MKGPYRVRPGTPADVSEMADLMAFAIRGLAPQRYPPAQVEVWAAAAHDEERFSRLLRGAFTVAVEHAGGLAGFGAIHPSGHLTALYVHPEHGRRGIGSRVLAELLGHAREHGIAHIHTEASDFSHPVFTRAGFRMDALETIQRNGVSIQRYRMSLSLPASGTAGEPDAPPAGS